MVKLAVFLENWPCKTRLHGSLAKPLIQDNIAPPPLHSFLRMPMKLCISIQDARKKPTKGRYQDSLERFSCRSELRPALFIIYAFRRH